MKRKTSPKDQVSRRAAARLILILSLAMYGIVLYLLCAAVTDAYRPTVVFTADATGRLVPPDPLTGDIDLNTADAEALQTLPGIGPKYGQAIVEYRESHGGFDFAEDLMNVRGIAEKRFEAVRPFIRLGEYRPPEKTE